MAETDIERHDRRYHPGGYKPGDSCMYREAKMHDDDADRLAAVERKEGEAFDAMQKWIDRYNGLANLMMTQPSSDEPYDKMLAEYGIKPGDKEYAAARSAIVDAQEWFEANDEGDDLTTYRTRVLDLHDDLNSIKKTGEPVDRRIYVDDLLNPSKHPSPKKSASGSQKQQQGRKAGKTRKSGGQQPFNPMSFLQNIMNQAAQNGTQIYGVPPSNGYDYETGNDAYDLYNLRGTLESVARLLNGRTGNLPALQASRRWNTLQDVAKDAKMGARLDALAKSGNGDIATPAASLKKVYDNIVKSSKNNWNLPAGTVIPEDDLPPLDDE